MPFAEVYHDRRVSMSELVAEIKSGQHIYVHSNAAVPLSILHALTERLPELEDLTTTHLLTLGELEYLSQDARTAEGRQRVRHQSWFAAPNTRKAINSGLADWVPVHLSNIAALVTSGKVKFDVALLSVSPPDEHGYCSLGATIEIVHSVVRNGVRVLAQVNAQMPRSLGDSFLHVTQIHKFVEVDHPLPELPRHEITEPHRLCAKHVAGLIEDGDCLQTGIGAMPDAVLALLEDRRNLGMHTELFSDGVVRLADIGVINGANKSVNRGKLVAGFVIGRRPTYDFIHNNPLVEMRPQDYVNDQVLIARQDNMVAINSALQIDLTGQVVADNLGPQIVSGFGGQLDFLRGAARSKGGRPILAMPSTGQGGACSRIVAQHPQGYGVTTTRADVHWVATEFGIVNLFGLNIRQRAKALIELAHPDFRGGLFEEAAALRLV